MTKAELVTKISTKTGQDEAIVLEGIEAFMKTINESLVNGENVYLRGFGSFIVKKRAPKPARIISKNKSIIIPEHFVPCFKPVKKWIKMVEKSPYPAKQKKFARATKTEVPHFEKPSFD